MSKWSLGLKLDPMTVPMLKVAGVSVALMILLHWHMHLYWVELYAQFPLEGYTAERTAGHSPDFQSSTLAHAIGAVMVAFVAFFATLLLPRHALLPAIAALIGAWVVPEAMMLSRWEGIMRSNLGPLGPLIHFFFTAWFLGRGALLGALLALGINRVRLRMGGA